MNVRMLDADELDGDTVWDAFRHNPPDKCVVTDDSYCGVWFTDSFTLDESYGVIGHYYAKDRRSSDAILEAACDLIRKRGCTKALGPMDGNTWRSYRFVTWSDGSPAFLMEPRNPPEWPNYWRLHGFAPCHEYVSTSVTNIGHSNSRMEKARKRLQESGIRWRSIEMRRFEQELKEVYRLSIEAFRENVLYSEIDLSSFLSLYLPYADSIDSRYVLLAHDGKSRCCGFIFAIPDLQQVKMGKDVDRLIVKTLAVRRNRRSGGLGAILVDEVQRRAFNNGFESAIHALMHEGNVSVNIGKNSSLLRRYTLFEKVLA